MSSHAQLERWYAIGVLVVLAASGCAGSDGATPVDPSRTATTHSRPRPASAHREVFVLATIQSGGDVIGRALPVQLTVADVESDGLQLEFDEHHSPGSGETWRASELSAAIQALLVTRVPPDGLKIVYDVEGDIDGPSAGALMTVGLMAALRDRPLDPEVSMTGTINPDGSIGAVSNIPAKVRGAHEHGLRTVLIPAGLRRGVDLSGPDVIDLGDSIGVEVREVEDIYEAYALMTGEPFDTPTGSEALPRYSTDFVELLDARAAEWRARFEEHLGAARQVDDAVAARLGSSSWLEKAEAHAARARTLAAAGKPAAAYHANSSAARAAAVARFLPEALSRVEASSVESVREWMEERGRVELNLSATLDAIEAVQPRTLNDYVALTLSFAGVLEAHSLEQGVDAIFDDLAADESLPRSELEATLVEAVAREIEASVYQLSASDYLAFRAALAGDDGPAASDLELVADVFSQAADANVALFETLALTGIATKNGLSQASVKSRFARSSKTYREVLSVGSLRERLDESIGDPRRLALAHVGLDLWRYIGGAELLATHYSLAVRIDPRTLGVEQFAITPALEAMFHSSSKQIRRSFRDLGAEGIDAQLVRATFEIGAEEARFALAAGDGPMLMRSLRYIWGTNVIASAFLLGLPPADALATLRAVGTMRDGDIPPLF